MTTKHTPTPWALSQNGCFVIDPVASQGRFGEYRIAEARGSTIAEYEANAALIVRAVNSHQVLIDALHAMVGQMWQHFEYHHDGDDECGMESCQRALDQARAALALAQEGAR